jgi:hypothetical protein
LGGNQGALRPGKQAIVCHIPAGAAALRVFGALTGERVVAVVCRGEQVVKDQNIPRTMGWQCLCFHILLLLIRVQYTRHAM